MKPLLSQDVFLKSAVEGQVQMKNWRKRFLVVKEHFAASAADKITNYENYKAK